MTTKLPRRASLAALSLLLVFASGCFRPGEERARLDEQVGFASAGGVSIHVRDGLAAVRTAEPGTFAFWSQSPTLVIDFDSSADATRQWTLRFSNSLPLSSLTALQGTDVVIERAQSDQTTTNTFVVTLPAGQQATLRLAPDDADSTAPFAFAVLSDIQGAIVDIDDVWAVMAADPALRFVASTGDLTEGGSAQQLDKVQRSLGGLPIPLFSTMGNHELGGELGDWHARFGRASFHWSFHGAHFSFLDSANAGIDPTVYGWLDGWLAQGRGAAHVMLTHFPPIDPVGTRAGAFRDRNEAAMLIGKLLDGRVDSTFHGHIHSFYAFSLGGIPAYISGGGGAIPERMDGIGRHYLKVTIDPLTQAVEAAIVRVD